MICAILCMAPAVLRKSEKCDQEVGQTKPPDGFVKMWVKAVNS